MSGREEEVYSARLPVGTRTYFFDIRESAGGERYMAITETRGVGDDMSECQRVVVFPEDALAFNEEVSKALRWIFEEAGSFSRTKRPLCANQTGIGGEWSEEEESALQKEYLRVGTRPTIDELAALLHKKPSEVRAKLQEMRLL